MLKYIIMNIFKMEISSFVYIIYYHILCQNTLRKDHSIQTENSGINLLFICFILFFEEITIYVYFIELSTFH